MPRNKNFVPKITKEQFEATSPHYCQCIDKCGQKIIWKCWFKYSGIARCISGHKYIKNTKYNILKLPICQCGCNQEISLTKENIRRKRYPKYIEGHRKNKTVIHCSYCNISIIKDTSYVIQVEHTFCSRECKIKWQSESRKGKKRPKEVTEKILNTRKERNIAPFTFRGKYHTEETKQKMSISAVLTYINGRTPSHGKQIKYTTKLNTTVTFRSTWELEFAKYLDSINEQWYYEFCSFNLGNTTYTPDFYLPRRELFIEIKGWWRDDSEEKYSRFLNEYSFINILLIQHPPPYTNIPFPPSSKQSLH